MMHSMRFAFSILASLLVLTGCASSNSQPATSKATPDSQSESQEVTYSATPEETQFLKSTEPLTPGRITMSVNGLSCPLCASNVDQQVKRLPGVSNVFVDLAKGRVSATLTGPKTPSPAQLAKAADDAGVTLVKIAQ